MLDGSAWPVVLEDPLLAIMLDGSVAPAVVVRPGGNIVRGRSEWIVISDKTVGKADEMESSFVVVTGKVTSVFS